MSPKDGEARGMSRRAGAHKRPKMKYAGQAKHVGPLLPSVLLLKILATGNWKTSQSQLACLLACIAT